MTGVVSFVADALHKPEGIPSLKFFLHLVSINGHVRKRAAFSNSVEAGEYPKSSVILRGTGSIILGGEMGLHRFRNRFCKENRHRVTYLFEL